MADLVPKVLVNQIFEDVVPVIPSTDLIPCVIGPSTLQVYRGEITGYTYTGGTGQVINQFPSYISGSIINDSASVLDVPEFPNVLRPHVFIATRYGTTEIDDSYITYNLGVTPPTLAVSPAASVLFTVSEGTTGSYSATTGHFTDINAAFDADLVGLGDKIYIKNSSGNYHYELDVTTTPPHIIENGQKLVVTKRSKVVITTSTTLLSALDPNTQLRALTNPNETFITSGVNAGDVVTVDNWSRLINHLGGDFSLEDSSNIRTLVDLNGDFSTALVVADDVVWYDKGGTGTMVPSFIVTSVPTSDLAVSVGNAIPEWPLATVSDTDRAYEVRRYATIRDLTGAAVSVANDGTFGSQGQTIDAKVPSVSTRRIFKSPTWLMAGAVAIGDFIILNRSGAPAVGPFLGAGNGLIFEVQDVTTHGNGYIEVSDITADWPVATKSAYDDAETFYYEIRDESSANISEQYGSTYTGQGGGGAPSPWRLFTDNDATYDFTALPTPPIPGDIIKDRDGLSIFRVEVVAPGAVVNALHVSDIDPNVPGPVVANSQFSYEIAKTGITAELLVVSVDSETQLSVVNKTTNPSTADDFAGLIVTSIVYPDLGANLEYYVEHTSAGADLTGSVLVTYTARRVDRVGELLQVTKTNYETVVGEATPANLLSLGLSKVFEVFDDTCFAIMVGDPTSLDSWKAALEIAKDNRIYTPALTTTDEYVLAEARRLVITESDPEESHEMQLYQCHKEVVQETRTSETLTDSVTYVKTTSMTTVVFNRDISSYGVIPTDVISGIATLGTDVTFANIRILEVQGSTPFAGQCTLVIANDNGFTVGSGTITGWSILSKNLSLDERKDKQATYIAALALLSTDFARKISNIWPDSAIIPFSDDVGIFGGGTQLATLDNWLSTCTYAGVGGFEEPVTPYAKRRYGTYYQLIDPFVSRPDLQRELVNCGNAVVRQNAINESPYMIRDVTIDLSDYRFAFGEIRRQVDYFSKKVRVATDPYVGPNSNIENTLDAIAITMTGVRDAVVDDEGNLGNATLKSLTQDPLRPDGLISEWELTVIYGLGKLTINERILS